MWFFIYLYFDVSLDPKFFKGAKLLKTFFIKSEKSWYVEFAFLLQFVYNTFVRSPDYSCVHDQTFVRSPEYSCVHDQTFVRSPEYSCVHDQTFVRSPDYSCVHDQTFVRSPDYSCVHVQTFVRFSLFPDHVNLNARHPRRAFIWVWTYRLSVWDLNLGMQLFILFSSGKISGVCVKNLCSTYLIKSFLRLSSDQ